jgi:hypothetical protein
MIVSCHKCGAPFWIDQDLMTQGTKRDHTFLCLRCAENVWQTVARSRIRKSDPDWVSDDVERIWRNNYRLLYSYKGDWHKSQGYRDVPHWAHMHISVGTVSFLVGGGGLVDRLFGNRRKASAA